MEIKEKNVTLKNGNTALIRPLMMEDAPTALALLQQAPAELPYLLREPGEMKEDSIHEVHMIGEHSDSPNHIQLGAFCDGELVGMVTLERMGEYRKIRHRGKFSILLKKAAWGVGLGKSMISAIIEAAPTIGIDQIELRCMSSNQRAIGLYEKMGFRTWGVLPRANRRTNGETEDETCMVLTL